EVVVEVVSFCPVSEDQSISLAASRNSRKALPSEDPISIMRLGPKTSSASPRMIRISNQCPICSPSRGVRRHASQSHSIRQSSSTTLLYAPRKSIVRTTQEVGHKGVLTYAQRSQML